MSSVLYCLLQEADVREGVRALQAAQEMRQTGRLDSQEMEEVIRRGGCLGPKKGIWDWGK
jgi:hypothetical protein